MARFYFSARTRADAAVNNGGRAETGGPDGWRGLKETAGFELPESRRGGYFGSTVSSRSHSRGVFTSCREGLLGKEDGNGDAGEEEIKSNAGGRQVENPTERQRDGKDSFVSCDGERKSEPASVLSSTVQLLKPLITVCLICLITK